MQIQKINYQANGNNHYQKQNHQTAFGTDIFLKLPDGQFPVPYSEGKLITLFEKVVPEGMMEKFISVINKLKSAAEEDKRGKGCSLILSNQEGKLLAMLGDIDEIGRVETPVEDLNNLDQILQHFIKNAGTLEWLGFSGKDFSAL